MPRTLPPARAASEQLRGAAPASRGWAGRGPKTRRRAPFAAPKMTPVIEIECLRAHGMGKEEISHLRAVLSGFEPKCACDAPRWKGEEFFGIGWGVRERCSSHPLHDASATFAPGHEARLHLCRACGLRHEQLECCSEAPRPKVGWCWPGPGNSSQGAVHGAKVDAGDSDRLPARTWHG